MKYQYLDLDYLEQFTGGDAAVRQQMLELLRSETEAGRRNIRQLLEDRAWTQLERELHHMKSTVAYLGNDPLSSLLEKAHSGLREGNPEPQAVTDFLEVLDPVFEELKHVQ